MVYDCVIVGGGIAGLQAAIQLGRYKHHTLVIDSNDGRSVICRSYHNILGYPDGVSGQHLRSVGKQHAEKFGVEFANDKILKVKRQKETFILSSQNEREYVTKRLLIATGVMDRIPPFNSLYLCLGKSVYVCPDCDGYEVKDKKTIVMGSGNSGANMALTLSYWTQDIIFINHEQKTISDDVKKKLKEKNISFLNEEIMEVMAEGEYFNGVRLKNNEVVHGDRGFIAFGGNEVRSEIGHQLGLERLENKHIVVDPRTKMTNVPNVWAAGDVVAHSEQVTIAMGEGSQAAIWIHKSLIQ
ncbi:NAD(P)/FAD-dependent oxidoreductase [Salirhabdus euzebyi]|nr:NAD(P)/FAD-dependent oxidoreductase [Salirhabdus euzebyi]